MKEVITGTSAVINNSTQYQRMLYIYRDTSNFRLLYPTSLSMQGRFVVSDVTAILDVIVGLYVHIMA